MRTFLLALLLSSSATAADNPLLGDWRLVTAIPGSMEDSAPNGVRNLRFHFGADGKVVMVDPSETLSAATTRNDYKLDGNTLTIKIFNDQLMHADVKRLPGDGLSFKFAESGMTWSLRRLPAGAIETQKLPPESVEFFPPATFEAVEAFKYDEANYNELPVAERVIGQWNVVEISGYGGGDFPPYGAPDEVWTFDGKNLTRHDRYHPEEPSTSEYHVADGTLLGKGGAVPFYFDEWGRLVVGEKDGMRTVMKRISRNGKAKVVMPPPRIVLGYPAGNG